jgi:hypothetical protein
MLSHIEVFPFGTWSERRTLSFSAKGNTSSKVCSSGEPITVVPIDDLVQTGERVTFIKMDVEGAELESLKGAEKTICRDRPKLAVCIYHKREDMVEIPLFIKKLVPDYKLYVRMHANDGNERCFMPFRPKTELGMVDGTAPAKALGGSNQGMAQQVCVTGLLTAGKGPGVKS